MATAEIIMGEIGGGGGSVSSGTFTIPLNNATQTIQLPFTPSKILVEYNKTSGQSGYYAYLIGAYSDVINKSISVDEYGTNPSSLTKMYDRLTIAPITNGFTVTFTAGSSVYWQANDAYYTAFA